MTLFLQIVSFVFILAAAVGWGHWVWDSNRSIEVPEKLSQILVHGIPESDALGLADAVAVGIIGRIAEHGRNVAFINEAAVTAVDAYGIQALTRVSQPAPSLLQASGQPKALDIAIEFAGSKVETKGLNSLLSIDSQHKGALSIALLLEKQGDKFIGLASSSFASNNAYGFAIPIEGKAQTIAEEIAMRFVQAHYAEEDSFYSALEPTDFRTFWMIRKNAAEIAIKASSGNDASVQQEAKNAYDSIKHLVHRYTKRPELQKLAAYLSSVSEDYAQAITHLRFLSDSIQSDEEKNKIYGMVSALEADARSNIDIEATTSSQSLVSTAYPGFTELEAGILSDPLISAMGASQLSQVIQHMDSARKPDLILVLGAFDKLAPFGSRVAPLSEQDRDVNDSLLPHTESVASVIATLAPSANVKVVKALDGSGGGTEAKILEAINRAIAAKPEVIVIPLGPISDIVKRSLAQAAKNSLVLVAAGNEREKMEHAKIPGVVFVGAENEGAPAGYSNYGKGVDFYAPGSVMTFDHGGKLARMTGTSYSVAIASAIAANLAALSKTRITPDILEQQLLLQTEISKAGRMLKIASEN
ncbi:S8 family peptidase [Neptunomonas qingdaonensis]|uniref:Subtilase family protein n=1 Tax=Neptunomonas qingdaonensis TaxID=1045558 RepID=A0A1I2LKS7_9GAMM|nr:S8 family serine peptidase [Neptunomonas qingdaonensis]SFF79885.1 Subtilase family protein [Neptunomonas qingdaonensis]